MRRRRRRRVAAVVAAARFDAGEQAIGQRRVGLAAERRPGPRQAGEVDEVETGAVAEPIEVGGGLLDGQWFLQGDERVEPEDGVVEIARAGAILKAAVRVETLAQKGRDQIARLTQLLWAPAWRPAASRVSNSLHQPLISTRKTLPTTRRSSPLRLAFWSAGSVRIACSL